MEFHEVLERRQSCRKYEDRRVEREKLVEIALAGRLSPSGCNSQRWAFIIVDDPDKCALLAQALKDLELGVNTFADQIPAYIAIVRHPARNLTDKQKILLGSEDFSDIDIGIAAQQMCLAATSLGLGSLMLGWIRRDMARKTLNIPENLSVPLLIGIGYPKSGESRAKSRYDAGEIIRVNDYAVPLEI